MPESVARDTVRRVRESYHYSDFGIDLSSLPEPAGDVGGVVGQDHVDAGALEAGEEDKVSDTMEEGS